MAGSVYVLGRMLDVLTSIAAARRDVADPSDFADLGDRDRRFRAITLVAEA